MTGSDGTEVGSLLDRVADDAVNVLNEIDQSATNSESYAFPPPPTPLPGSPTVQIQEHLEFGLESCIQSYLSGCLERIVYEMKDG